MRAVKCMCGAALTLAAGGCVVGPNYHAPNPSLPSSFDAGPASRPADSRAVDIAHWWKGFGDQELNSLVERAIRSNLDLRIALARLQQARAQEYVVSGGMLPLVDITAGAGRGTGSDSTRSRVGAPLHSASNTKGYTEITHVAGFDAAWEPDLFGRFTRQMQATRADTQAVAEARNDVLSSVVADVARAFSDVRANQLRLQVALENLKSQQQTVDLVRARFKQGMTNELDVALAARQLAAVQAVVPPLRAAIGQAERRIAVLLGELPQNLYSELDKPASLPSPPAGIAAGLPIELLRRRPDIRGAERRLAASTAQLGVATADLFPRIALVGSLGVQGQGLGRTPVLDRSIWSFGPSAYWPVLDFGTLDATVELQDYRTRELLYQYRRTVLLAVEEVDNAISNYTAEGEGLDRLDESVAASRRAVALATQRYDRGLSDFLNVLDAQRQLYELEDQRAISQQTVIVQFIALYKALGGGWESYQQVPGIRQPRPAILAAGSEIISNGSKHTP